MNIIPVLLVFVSLSQAFTFARLDDKIVHGQEVNIEEYPYMVSVRKYDQHHCGGCIINANTILTAAHCFLDMYINIKQYSIRVGDTNHNQGQFIRVYYIIKHSNYNPATIDYDVAILNLFTPLRYGPTIQPISLQPQGEIPEVGSTAWVSGWGLTSESGQTVPQNLRAVDVAVISQSSCKNSYGPNRITSRMICAQTISHDACQKDSGGPLVSNGRLIGIVSWGYGCARPQYPGVYANVSELNRWIVLNS